MGLNKPIIRSVLKGYVQQKVFGTPKVLITYCFLLTFGNVSLWVTPLVLYFLAIFNEHMNPEAPLLPVFVPWTSQPHASPLSLHQSFPNPYSIVTPLFAFSSYAPPSGTGTAWYLHIILIIHYHHSLPLYSLSFSLSHLFFFSFLLWYAQLQAGSSYVLMLTASMPTKMRFDNLALWHRNTFLFYSFEHYFRLIHKGSYTPITREECRLQQW